MVFLLGKSGSGKSTLLNVIGGLDTFDEGEVIIKGRSSRKFKGSDFDAYRNTFIGFIFQEYNILDEFSVGANIALALELQGKKATSEAINTILEQVDLLDFANRKPNELSGGQKQRIAIARALIKDPQIIMADEPTGALDSTTGKQVLETLKKLSQTKLVLVVSHDREFAETYGDRIIELADGRVISDMSQEETVEEVVVEEEVAEEGEDIPQGLTVVDDSIIHISRGYTLTLEDMDIINAYLRRGDRDIILSKDDEVNEGVRAKKGLRQARGKRAERRKVTAARRPTGTVETRTYNPAETRFIKSRLPVKNAVKIGTASMKAKPIRLIFTIFLSFIAFAMFGLADTMAAYNQFTATVDSIRDSQMSNIAIALYLRENHQYKRDGEWVSNVYYDNREDTLNEDDIAALEEATGLDFMGVYNGTYNPSDGVSISSYLTTPKNLKNGMDLSFFEGQSVGGITELTREDAEAMGFTVEGRFPEKDSEIVITKYLYQMMYLAGVQFGDTEILPEYLTTEEGDAASILGRTLTLFRRDFTIVGVVDTGFDFNQERYAMFHWDYTGPVKDSEMWQVRSTLESELRYGYHTLVIGFPGVIDSLPNPQGGVYREYGAYFQGDKSPFLSEDPEGKEGRTMHFNRYVGNQEIGQFSVVWLSSGNKTVMGAKEIILPINFCLQYEANEFGLTLDSKVLPDILKDVLTYENEYPMRDWLYEYDINYDTVYEKYVATMEKKGETPVTFEEYSDEICAFLNAYYRINLSKDLWKKVSGIGGGILSDYQYVIQDIDTYATDRAIWNFILEHEEAITNESKDSNSEFYKYLNAYLGSEGLQNFLAIENEEDRRPLLLSYAALYIRENEYTTAFGATETFNAMITLEKEATKELEAQHYNTLYGVEFTYDMWMGLMNNGGSEYLKEYVNNMQLQDFVREKMIFEFVAANWEDIKAQSLEKGTGFNTYLHDIGIDAEGNYDPDKKPGNGYSLEYNEGILFSRAMDYVRQCNDNGSSAFGQDVKTQIENKTIEYAMAGAQNLTFPKLYFGYEQHFDGGSQRVMEKHAYTIAGFFMPDNSAQNDCLLSEDLYLKALDTQTNNDYKVSYGEHKSGRYVMALAKLPKDNRAVLETLATLHNEADSDFEFRMKNNVADVIDQWGETILQLNKIFLYVGIGFAVFAALMMLNFISVSVTYKKKEIGILRALGARSSDVFSIFFSEAFFIALINFVLAIASVFVASYFINGAVRTELGFPITLLHAGPRQIGLVFGISVLVAFVGSFFPVRKIAKKNPIDAMKDR